MCVKVMRKKKEGWKDRGIKNKNLVHRNAPRLEKESLGALVFNQARLIPVLAVAWECGTDGHFLLAAPGPPRGAPQSRGTCALV